MNKNPHCVLFILFAAFLIVQPAFAVLPDESPLQEDSISPTGYALVMANGTALKISQYEIDLERETVYFKSLLSGLNATFPLERIARVVSYDASLTEVPDDAAPLYIPENSVGNIEDDGGIPVVFKVTKTIVGSGGSGAAGEYSRAGAGRSGDYRQSYTPSRSTGYSSSSSSSTSRTNTQSKVPTSTRRPSSSSSSSSSSSNSAADNFFNALFGGR